MLHPVELSRLTFSKRAQRAGERLFEAGNVRELLCRVPDKQFVAEVSVRDDEYRVAMIHAKQHGWTTQCSCAEVGCAHSFAAILALIDAADTTLPEVKRQDSRHAAAISLVPPRADASVATESARSKQSFAKTISGALGRPLSRDEQAYVGAVEALFQQCSRNQTLSGWSLRTIGIEWSGSPWEPIRPWTDFPNDVLEFWQGIAVLAVASRIPIPEFMHSVLNKDQVHKRAAAWQRSLEIERWSDLIAEMKREALAADAATIELRLRFESDSVKIESRRSHEQEFAPLKISIARQMLKELRTRRADLSSSSTGLTGLLEYCSHKGQVPSLSYSDDLDRQELAEILQHPHLRACLATSTGAPFHYSDEILRWKLHANEHDPDYTLSLVQSNGQPAPPPLVMLPGHPAYYVSAEIVYKCPDSALTTELNGGGARIPAPALENPRGVEFLQQMRVEIPARLRDSIQIVPVRAKLRCELESGEYPGAIEHCRITLLATSEVGGLREAWNGQEWLPIDAVGRPRGNVSESQPEADVFYDREAPLDALRRLKTLPIDWNTWRAYATLRLDKKFPEVFVPWLKSLPPHVEVELVGELASLTNNPVLGRVKLNVTETSIDWFDLQVVLDLSVTDLSPEEIKLLLNAKGRHVRLKGKGWRRLQYDLTAEDDENLARLGLTSHDLGTEPQRLHALQLADVAAKRFLPSEQCESVQRRASEIQTRVAPDLPASVKAELRAYQRDGFHFLAYLSSNRFGGILADDMGLGKTLQALAWIAWLRERDSATTDGDAPVLVVCPKSVMDNWCNEAARFTPDLRVTAWIARQVSTIQENLSGADLHVINYAQLRSFATELTAIKWRAVILDEGQYIKNPSSQTAQVARSLKAQHRLILTGTPIENRLLDLWSLLAFAMPGTLGSRAQFERTFQRKEDPFARARLAARVRPFLLRRTKAQVAKDLPERIEKDLYCELEGEQLTLYRAELKRAQQLLLRVKTQKELAKEQFNFLTSLMRLRQVCCHPRLVREESQASSAKIEALLELLEQLMDEGQKVLIFSQFVGMLDLLKEALAPQEWRVFYLAGDTENRGALVDEFQNAAGAAVFLISLKAGGFGLNLTAASYVVLFDPWWNPAVENQAIDRTHRIGQSRNVIAYRLLIKNTIEEKIRSLQIQKKALADDVLGEERFSQSLTLADFKYLFAE